MATFHWKLNRYLHQKGISAYKLTKTVEGAHTNTVYRLARDETPARLDLATVASVLVALRRLTGEPVELANILEFDPDGRGD